MKVALFGKVYADNQKDYLQLLIDELTKRDSQICVFEPYYKAIKAEVNFGENISFFNSNRDIKNKVDILFSIGGDGTILDTITTVRGSNVPIIGLKYWSFGVFSQQPQKRSREFNC